MILSLNFVYLQNSIQLGRTMDESTEVFADEFEVGSCVGVVPIHRRTNQLSGDEPNDQR